MADIYASSLQAKYESVLRIVSSELGFGDDLTALTKPCAELVHNAAEQAILDWAAQRAAAGRKLPPISNLQHLLDEYCAIADHL